MKLTDGLMSYVHMGFTLAEARELLEHEAAAPQKRTAPRRSKAEQAKLDAAVAEQMRKDAERIKQRSKQAARARLERKRALNRELMRRKRAEQRLKAGKEALSLEERQKLGGKARHEIFLKGIKDAEVRDALEKAGSLTQLSVDLGASSRALSKWIKSGLSLDKIKKNAGKFSPGDLRIEHPDLFGQGLMFARDIKKLFGIGQIQAEKLVSGYGFPPHRVRYGNQRGWYANEVKAWCDQNIKKISVTEG